MCKPLQKVFLIMLTVMTTAGCQMKATNNNTSVPSVPSVAIVDRDSTESVNYQQEIEKAIFIGVDQSASMNANNITKVMPHDLDNLTSSLLKSGGSLAVAAICDNSNRPLSRANFLAPQPAPNYSLPSPPDPEKTNPFDYPRSKQQYDQQVARIQSQNNSWQSSEDNRLATNTRRLQAIQPQIEQILNKDWNCSASDIHTAIQRAEIYFQESPHTQSQKYMLLITDGEDTNSTSPAKIKNSSIQVIVVSGTDTGIFASIPHQRFESPLEAINFLVNQINQ